MLGRTTVYDVSQNIDLNTVPLNGGFLLKTLALSIDPFMRGKSRLGLISVPHISDHFDFSERRFILQLFCEHHVSAAYRTHRPLLPTRLRTLQENRESTMFSYRAGPGLILRARLANFGVAVVLRSENAEISVGDHLYGWLSEFDGISCSTPT